MRQRWGLLFGWIRLCLESCLELQSVGCLVGATDMVCTRCYYCPPGHASRDRDVSDKPESKADRASVIQRSVAFGIEQDVKVIQFGVHDAEICSESLCCYDVHVIIVLRISIGGSVVYDIHGFSMSTSMWQSGLHRDWE